jgi:hypothetical protein
MATLYVAEYKLLSSTLSSLNFAPVTTQAPQEPPTTEQVVSIAASSTASQPFNQSTTLIRVHADSICSVAIGTNPTATTTNKRLAANQTEYFGVAAGQQIAVIQNV